MHRRAPRPRDTRNRPPFLVAFLAIAALAIGVLTPLDGASADASATARSAADPASAGLVKSTLVGFSAGNIISDAVFTNKNTMTEAQIQTFFNSKISKCLGGKDENGKAIVCLKDFTITSVTRQADAYCKGYTGAANETAARIIYKVAQSCNINPQVLIVMLQKEQGLVTHTWPSAWRFNIALGQGCPDTAACDPNYIGFFHQIYGAARQMQIYLEGKWFQWYAPGKTWNVLYNPNSACGSAPVYIANAATAALYYYTPYQPNAAALAAGYGTGNSCSAYGNRNFYNYFTDWFGSTQSTAPDGPIVNVGNDIYAITNGTAYHIGPGVWPQYRAAFGSPEATTLSHIQSLRQGGPAYLFLHDVATGTVAYLDGGATHRFPSCALVAAWGGSCSALTNFDKDDFRIPAVGAQMTERVNVTGQSLHYVIEGDQLVPYYDQASAEAWGQRTGGFAGTMLASVATKMYRALPTRFVPGRFLTVAGSTRVYLPSQDGELHYLPSWELAMTLGLARTVTSNVPSSALAQYRTTTDVGRFVGCGDRVYFAAGGSLYRVTSSGGASVVTFDAKTCALFRIADDTAAGLYFRTADDTTTYTVLQGTARHVANPTTLTALNGPGAVRRITVTAAELASMPKGPPLRADIGFVTTPADGRVYLADSGRLIYLGAWATAEALGWPRSALTISDAAASAIPKTGSLSSVVSCGGKIYVGQGGVLTEVTSAPSGTTVTTLSAANCATLRLP